MIVKKTQQNLSTTLEKTEQTLGGLENSLGNDVEASLLEIAENSEANDGLPEGWVATNLENVTEILDSQRKPVNNKERASRVEGKKASELFPYYGATGKVGYIDGYLFDGEFVALGEDGVPFLDVNKNKAYLLAGKTWVNNHAHVLSEIGGLSLNKVLLHFLNQFDYHDYVNGGTRLKLTQANMRKIPFPLPPLAEQTVIAQTLDTLLAQVDNIKTRLDAIPKILKTFRQSVLAAAVSGKLTEEWRGESVGYSSASLNGGSWGDLPNNWQVKAYKEVVDSRLGKMLDKAKNSGIPTKYLGNINVRWFSIDLEKTQEILVSEDEISELSLKIGDVLICEGGEPGRCAIWKQEQSEAIVFQKALHRARVSSDLIPEWLLYNLKNDADNLFLEQFFTGTTIKHLTGKALAKYLLRLPPVKEQTQIVRRVEELFAFADKIEQQVKNAQGRVNNLTQSILAKAFRGELTAQWRAENPDLISGDSPENGSAELLLAKIKAEREALKQKAKPKKKTALKKIC